MSGRGREPGFATLPQNTNNQVQNTTNLEQNQGRVVVGVRGAGQQNCKGGFEWSFR